MRRILALCLGILLMGGLVYEMKYTFKSNILERFVSIFGEGNEFPTELLGSERVARIDIHSKERNRLKDVLSGGTRIAKVDNISPPGPKDISWMGRGVVGDVWRELWIEFTPTKSGSIMVEFKGDFYEKVKIRHRSVWVDDIKVEGGYIKNGSFEELDDNGNPLHWSFDKLEGCSKDRSIAKAGKVCVLVWHDQGISQDFDVEAGRKYRISAWFKAAKNN